MCGLPANRLRVKKEGATKGRHFYKCPQQICEFFAWDQAEMEAIKTNVKKAPEVSPEISKQLEEMEQTKQELLRREGQFETERGLSASDAKLIASRCTAVSGNSGGAGGTETSGGHGVSAGSIPRAVGADAKPADLAHGIGWREQSGRGDGRSSEEPGGDGTGFGTSSEDADGGKSSRSSDGGSDASLKEEQTANRTAVLEGSQDWNRWQTELDANTMEALLTDAPWASFVTEGKAWNTAVRVQLQERYKPEEERSIQPVFWLKEQGKWKFHQGILPSNPVNGGAVLAVTCKPQSEDVEDEKGGLLKKGVRKRLLRKMEEVTSLRGVLRAKTHQNSRAFGHERRKQF